MEFSLLTDTFLFVFFSFFFVLQTYFWLHIFFFWTLGFKYYSIAYFVVYCCDRCPEPFEEQLVCACPKGSRTCSKIVRGEKALDPSQLRSVICHSSFCVLTFFCS